MGKVINVQMDEDFYNEIIQGGGSGGGYASSIEYLDMRDKNIDHEFKLALLAMSNNIKIYDINANPMVYISPYSYINFFMGHIPDHIANMAIACEVDCSKIVFINPNGTYIVEDWLKAYNLQELFNSVPRITKEQFYSLE